MIDVDFYWPSNLIYILSELPPALCQKNNKQLKNEIVVLFSVTNLIPEMLTIKRKAFYFSEVIDEHTSVIMCFIVSCKKVRLGLVARWENRESNLRWRRAYHLYHTHQHGLPFSRKCTTPVDWRHPRWAWSEYNKTRWNQFTGKTYPLVAIPTWLLPLKMNASNNPLWNELTFLFLSSTIIMKLFLVNCYCVRKI